VIEIDLRVSSGAVLSETDVWIVVRTASVEVACAAVRRAVETWSSGNERAVRALDWGVDPFADGALLTLCAEGLNRKLIAALSEALDRELAVTEIDARVEAARLDEVEYFECGPGVTLFMMAEDHFWERRQTPERWLGALMNLPFLADAEAVQLSISGAGIEVSPRDANNIAPQIRRRFSSASLFAGSPAHGFVATELGTGGLRATVVPPPHEATDLPQLMERAFAVISDVCNQTDLAFMFPVDNARQSYRSMAASGAIRSAPGAETIVRACKRYVPDAYPALILGPEHIELLGPQAREHITEIQPNRWAYRRGSYSQWIPYEAEFASLYETARLELAPLIPTKDELWDAVTREAARRRLQT